MAKTFNIDSGDVIVGNRGVPTMVEGTDGLNIEVMEILATSAELIDIVGQVTVPEQVESMIAQAIITVLTEFVASQRDGYSDQREDTEVLDSIQTLLITRAEADLTWQFKLGLLSIDGVERMLTGTFKLGG